MTKSKKILVIVLAALALCVVAAILIYTRSFTIEQRYPALDMSECTKITGYYEDGEEREDKQFALQPEDPHFAELLEMFSAADFKTRLSNLLPQSDTKTHAYEEGDTNVYWRVLFSFEDTVLPDGSTASGYLLQVDNFFGDLELMALDDSWIRCSVSAQDQWAQEIFAIIRQYTV